jgi:hypothetical protein
MIKPGVACLAVLLACAGVLVGAAPRRSSTVTIDRSFLAKLEVVRPEDDKAWERAGKLVGDNYDELIYLARKGDRDAVRVVQRFLVINRVPGGCSCGPWDLARCVYSAADLPPAFYSELAKVPAHDQGRVLGIVDEVAIEIGLACGTEWPYDRGEYLKKHPAVLRTYTPCDTVEERAARRR